MTGTEARLAGPDATGRDLWFQVVSSGPADPERGGDRALRIHAKTFGTVSTACGLNTYGLTKSWDQAFDPASGIACPDCAHRVGPLVGRRPVAR